MSRLNSRASNGSKRVNIGSLTKSEDADGWTFLSHPSSASSSPERGSEALTQLQTFCSTPKKRRNSDDEKSSAQNQSEENSGEGTSASYEKLDDGLTEINLIDDSSEEHVYSSNSQLSLLESSEVLGEQQVQSSSPGSIGYQRHETSLKARNLTQGSLKTSRKSSIDANDFVDLHESNDELDTELVSDADRLSYVGGRSLNSDDENSIDYNTSSSSREAESENSELIEEDQTRSHEITCRQGQMNITKVMLKSRRRRLVRNRVIDPILVESDEAKQKNFKQLAMKSKLLLISLLAVYLAIAYLCVSTSLNLLDNLNMPQESHKDHLVELSNEEQNKRGNLYTFAHLAQLSAESLITSKRQVNELKQLHSELRQCIQRQSPSSFNYFRSDLEPHAYQHRHLFNGSLTHYRSNTNGSSARKPFRGLVCFGQEARWRQRLARLEQVYHVNLRKFVGENKNQLASEILEKQYPDLNFKLILNQIEFSDLIESKLNRKHQQETIRSLKAENQQLNRRLNEPQNTSCYKLLRGLELEKSKLTRENGALYERLMEKIGPTYIRQMTRLEQCENDKHNLRSFQSKLLDDVSRGMRGIDMDESSLQATNAIVIDDPKSLEAQLSMTRRYLARLHKKLDTLEAENERLQLELAISQASNDEKVKNSIAKTNAHQTTVDVELEKRARKHGEGNSNALIADSCFRNLRELQSKSQMLEAEVAKLKKNCSCSLTTVERQSELQLAPGKELNLTIGQVITVNNSQPTIDWDPVGAYRRSLNVWASTNEILQKSEEKQQSQQAATPVPPKPPQEFVAPAIIPKLFNQHSKSLNHPVKHHQKQHKNNQTSRYVTKQQYEEYSSFLKKQQRKIEQKSKKRVVKKLKQLIKKDEL